MARSRRKFPPAVRNDVAVIANYLGYLPNGLVLPPGGEAPRLRVGDWGQSPDAKPEFATGVVALRYNPTTDRFDVLWENSQLQVSGVPTISESSNMVYGSGAEEPTRKTYFYGLRLLDDAKGRGGEVVIRQEFGVAPFSKARRNLRGQVGSLPTEYRFEEGEFFDAGNNLIILEDGSASVNGGRALTRVRNRQVKP